MFQSALFKERVTVLRSQPVVLAISLTFLPSSKNSLLISCNWVIASILQFLLAFDFPINYKGIILGWCLQWPMAFCKSEEFTIAKVGNSFCNFVLFHYATNIYLQTATKSLLGWRQTKAQITVPL